MLLDVFAPCSRGSMQSHELLRVLVHDPRYAQRRRHLQQIGRKALVQAANAFVDVRLVCHVPDARVRRWVHHGTLGLQSRSQHVERVYHSRTKGSRCRSNNRRHDVAWCRVLFVNSIVTSLLARKVLLQKLKGAHVDRTVREHAHQAHGNAPVRRAECTLGDHLARCLYEKRIASGTALDSLALQSEF